MTRYLFPAFLALLSVVIYGFYIQPLYKEIQIGLAKEVELKGALAMADTAQAKLDEIAASYESFPADADQKLSEILPEKIDPIRLLIETTAFMEHNGFSAKSLAITEEKSEGETGAPYKKHKINFSISASYDTFRGFLHVLEQSLVLRDLSTVSFTVGVPTDPSTRTELAIHTYNIQIIGYSLR